MNDRNDLVNSIMDGLGPDGSRELAERIFDELRSDDRIYWDDSEGLVMRDDIDLISVASDLL